MPIPDNPKHRGKWSHEVLSAPSSLVIYTYSSAHVARIVGERVASFNAGSALAISAQECNSAPG
jgi:hypothetical protein